MTKVQIKEDLSRYNNFVELFARANELKSSGEDTALVNKVVMELRKSLMKSTSTIKRMVKTPVAVLNEIPIEMQLSFVVENLSKPIIVFDGENILI